MEVETKLLLVIGLLLGLAGFGWYEHHTGYSSGVDFATKRDAAAAAANDKATAAKIQQLTDAARAKEQQQAAQVAAIAANLEQEKQYVNSRTKKLLAASRAHTLILRDPGPRSVQPCDSSPPKTPPAPGQRDGAQGSELSEAAAGFLLELTSEADEVARQLAHSQQVILEDRK